MNAVEMIQLYGNLFYVSLAIAVIGLGLAVFFFFYFDIPTVYALMTGKAKEDTIRRMAEQNAKTGNLRNQYIHTGPTGRTKSGTETAALQNTGRVAQAPVQVSAGQTAPLYGNQANETTVLGTDGQETTVLGANGQETTVLGSYGQETTVLGSYGQETTVLGGYGQETTVLGGNGQETTVLGGYGQETTVLSGYAEDTMVLNQGMVNQGETAMLSGSHFSAPQPTVQGYRFEITESTLVIHTNEII